MKAKTNSVCTKLGHSDYLGSTSYITDTKANITQFDAYLPYGELLVDEHSSSEDMPYKFNGKELDQETGSYYYGARYMNPVTSLWYGVDALTEKYPRYAAFVYTYCNPIIYRDSIGKEGNVGSQSKKPQINIIERGGVIYANGHLIGEKPLRPVYPEFKITLFGRLAQNISTIIKLVNADNSRSYTQHTIVQMRQRGFSERNVETIINRGNATPAMGRYGPQTRYELGGNTVVVNQKGEIITVFSNAPKTSTTPRGYYIPVKK